MHRDDTQDTDLTPTGIVLAQASSAEATAAIWLVHRDRALPLGNWAEQWPCARFASVSDLVRQWATHHADLRRL